MKLIITLITILFITLLSSPSWSENLTIDDLVETNGLYYKKFSDVPFSGELTGIETGKIKDGLKNGVWKVYWKTGQLQIKQYYKNGVFDGKYEYFNKNGILETRGQYRDGKDIGLWEFFHDNGKLEFTSNIKNQEDDVTTFYNENGLIEIIRTHKKNNVDLIVIEKYFNEDGNLEKTLTYKNYQLVDED